MDATLEFPLLRRAALGVHGFVAGWILLNGLAHSGAVLWKDRAGTLGAHQDAGSLLWVGAGLIAAGALLAAAWPSLAAGGIALPLAALGFFVAVIAAIAAGYGFTFLTGSITLASLDLLLLVGNARLNG